jgi:hypothetical protein
MIGQVEALVSDADSMGSGLAKSATAYVSAEDASLASTLHAFDKHPEAGSAAARKAADDVLIKGGLWLMSLVGLAGADGVLQQKVQAFGALKQAEKDAWAEAGKAWESELGVWSGTAGGEVDAAMETVSTIGMMSEETATALTVGTTFSLAAVGALAAWTAGALVMISDEKIDAAIGTWAEIAHAVDEVFNVELPALKNELLRNWSGDAGQALSGHAVQLKTQLCKVVNDLNVFHTLAFGFAVAQIGLMIITQMQALANPMAIALVQQLGLILEIRTTIFVNAIGLALGGVWLTLDAW